MIQRITFQAMVLASIGSASVSALAAEWVDVDRSVEGDAKIQLSTVFGKKSGKFKAIPESMLDNRRSIEGNFSLGTYRYVYSHAEQEDGPVFDEKIVTEVLDCQKNYFGTAKEVRKYKGKVVAEKLTSNADISMMELSGASIDAQLCELHAGKVPASRSQQQVPNPNYNPNPSDKDIDAILDKHVPKKTK